MSHADMIRKSADSTYDEERGRTAMTERTKATPQAATSEDRPRYVQFWVIAVVFLLISALFFITAMMDVWRLERFFLDYGAKKAQYILEGLQKDAEEWFDYLLDVYKPRADSLGHPPPPGEAPFALSPLAKRLIDAAKHIQSLAQAQLLSPESLQGMAASQDLAAIVVVDEGGRIRTRTGPVPEALLNRAMAMVDEGGETAIQLPKSSETGVPGGFVGLRNRDGKGMVILVLDAKNIRDWGMKIAVQKAVEESTWVKAVAYLVVEDSAGRQIARAGYIPRGSPKEGAFEPVEEENPSNSLFRRVEAGDLPSVEFSLPFQLHGETIGKAWIGFTKRANQLLVQDRRHIFLWTGVTILIGLLAMGLLYHTQNRHMAKLHAMNERLHQAERISSLARLAAGVAHEIRNPLNAVSMAAQRLQREFSPQGEEEKAEFQRITHIIRDEIRRLDSIVEDFLGLSRTDRLDLHVQPIKDILLRIGFLLRDEAEAMGVCIVEEPSDFSPMILMDVRKMEQALLNIFRNAMESITGKGSITVSVERSGKNRASVKVRDTGPGIPPEDTARVFDPFYTTKKNGVGIGLCIAHQIVLAHGGEILVHSNPGRGTTFEILLPEATP